jgi:hypothetical protein
LAGVRTINGTDSDDVMEALDEFEIGVSHPHVEVRVRQRDRPFAVEESGGPGDLFPTSSDVVNIDNDLSRMCD